MELQLLDASGLPERGLLALRAGTLRRQAQLSGLENRKWEVPCAPNLCGSVKVEILESVARGQFTCEAGEQSYTMKLDIEKDSGRLPMEVRFLVRPLASSSDGTAPPVDADESRASTPAAANARHKVSVEAQKYLEEHGLHTFFQSLLQKLIRDKPSEPYSILKAEIAGTSAPAAPPSATSAREYISSPRLTADDKLSKLLGEHPYLERDDTHPLQPLVTQCREFISTSSLEEAESTLKQIATGLENMVQNSEQAEVKASSITLMRTEVSERTLGGVEPSCSEQLQKLIEEHPYLEPGNSVHAHTLHYWVRRCRGALEMASEAEAEMYFRRVTLGLEADKKQITEAFRRFDVDGSGNLDAAESRHMCAYLGWDAEEVNLMDMNEDGQLTVIDFLSFVGRMGGVQRLFELRRKRVAHSRRDVMSVDVAAVTVGSRVRAHFFINGEKSTNWQEGVVLDVGVRIKSESRKLGVRLEFGFLSSEQGQRWKARQVIPANWIISTIEDANVAAALREVGILEDQQAFWNSILPQSEMREIGALVGCQRAALAYIRGQAGASHEKALPEIRQRFEQLGYGEYELQAVFSWIQDLAPVVVHVHLDQVGPFMEIDEFYRNQFETQTSCGALDDGNQTRVGWERDLFGDAYENAKAFDRCKYGALGVLNDYRGVTSANQYGDSYMVLKDVRLRCTFAATDSGGIQGSRLAVLDKYAHVLSEYNDKELHNLVGVATSEEQGVPAQLLRGPSEDPTSEWVTFGFPELKQHQGCFYFEVELHEDCKAPQVGLLSSSFSIAPKVASASGVGDDEHGWAVDGQHAARWHKGEARAWSVVWPRKGSGDQGLAQKVVVGVAVDLDSRTMWASSDGVWDESPVFGNDDFPEGSSVYPAMSVQGRAAFIFGPDFRHSAPTHIGNFARWPGTPGGFVRIDCPRVGNSDVLDIYKEAQIHGEICFKKHVQRLVAHWKHRDMPKARRSVAMSLTGGGSLDGEYERVGAYSGFPFYKSSKEAILFWNPSANVWCINSEADFNNWRFTAPARNDCGCEPPRVGWKVPFEERGSVPVATFRSVLSESVDAAVVEQLASALTIADSSGQEFAYQVTRDTSFESELAKLAGKTGKEADTLWAKIVAQVQLEYLQDAGFSNASIVQTAHPYPAKASSWKRTVRIPGAAGLKVHFASCCTTYDSCAPLTITPTNVKNEVAGIGSRFLVFTVPGETKHGTVTENRSDGSLLVKLDEGTANGNSYAVCEEEPVIRAVQYAGGVTVGSEINNFVLDKTFPATPIRIGSFAAAGPAQEAGVQESWYLDLGATLFGPSESQIAALEGDGYGAAPSDVDDALQRVEEIHRRLEGLTSLADVTLVFRSGLSYQLLPEAMPCYTAGVKIGDEIESFGCDDYGNMTVGNFKSAGPAQAAGVSVGWKLDIARTLGTENPGTAPAIDEEALLVSLPDCPELLAMSDVTLVFERPEKAATSQPEAVTLCGHDSQWQDVDIEGDTAEFHFRTDGDGGSYPDMRWGFFALVLPRGSGEPPPKDQIDGLTNGYAEITRRAGGLTETPKLEKQGFDEARIRALCQQHGWDFEWMTEDGERRRRIGERQGRVSNAMLRSVSRKMKGGEGQPDGFTAL